MIGPLVNGVAVVLAGVLGQTLCGRISKEFGDRTTTIFGCAAMGMGISMIVKVNEVPALVLSLLLGYFLGEAFKLETRIRDLALAINKTMPTPRGSQRSAAEDEHFSELFVALMILFCASAPGIFGAIAEGMTGDPSMLLAKSFLDFFTGAIFAATLGISVALLAIPQILVQGGLLLGASSIMGLVNDAMLADFSAVGGIVLLATGLRVCRAVDFPLASMLPALLLAMPISALWSYVV